MPDMRSALLIVDDDPSIRSVMSQVLADLGFRVRCAEDGFSALRQISLEMPAILVSDLNMPGMSGFELLSVVRRRFPEMAAIAMSGSFSGDEVPSGVAADAFYQKGSSIGALLRLIATLPPTEGRTAKHTIANAPIWIQRNGHDLAGEAFVTLACPHCLRTFPQALGGAAGPIRRTDCIHCHGSIHFAIVQPGNWTIAALPQQNAVERQTQAGIRSQLSA